MKWQTLILKSKSRSEVNGSQLLPELPTRAARICFPSMTRSTKTTGKRRCGLHGNHAASHAPPEYADREQLWNAVEAVENQWNSQLARRFVLALPREVPEELYPQMVQDYCNQFFVSKGMIVDFAIHDPSHRDTIPIAM